MKSRNERVLVTGGTRGLGRELVVELKLMGYRLVTCGRKQPDSVIEGVTYCHLDLRSPSASQSLVEQANHSMGGIDVLVNNASIVHPPRSVEELQPQMLREVFDVNVYAAFELMRNVVPLMRNQKNGLIVNVSSYCGRRAIKWLSAYCSSKFALRGLTEGAAQEFDFRKYGIKCVSVSPGGMNTDMRRFLFGNDDASRQQDPKYVASVIAKIISGEIDVPNGADVVVRGGQYSIRVPEV